MAPMAMGTHGSSTHRELSIDCWCCHHRFSSFLEFLCHEERGGLCCDRVVVACVWWECPRWQTWGALGEGSFGVS